MPKLPVLMLSLALLALTRQAAAQIDDPQSQLLALEDLDRQVGELSQFDRFNHQALEPLLASFRVAIELNQFELAAASMERALQITRISQGLYAEEQIPLLKLMVENDIRRGEWTAVNSNLEHLYWLLTRKRETVDAELIDELMTISRYHLQAVNADHVDNQGYHYLNATGITRLAVRAGSLLWGDHDLRLVPLQYELVKLYFRQAAAIEDGGNTAMKLRAVVPGTGWTHSRKAARRSLYQAGLSRLRDMQRSFDRQTPPDREAAAMVSLYIADWQLLFAEENAAEAYQAAYQRLAQSGVDAWLLSRYFAEPVPLPIESFHTTLAQAREDRSRPHWIATAAPRSTDEVATVALTLGPLTKISRWIDGRYVSRMGVAQTVEILQQPAGDPLAAEEMGERFHDLHFRPRLNGGAVEPVQTTFNYLLTAD